MPALLAHAGLLLASYDTDALALIARMSTEPPSENKAAISTAIRAMKEAGIWSKLDTFYMPIKAHAQQAGLLDWIRSTKSATLQGSATWTAADGFNGSTSAGSYVNPDYAPDTDGVQYTQNNASMGCYIGFVPTSGFPKAYFGETSGVAVTLKQNAATQFASSINASNAGENSTTGVTATGLAVIRRTASNAWAVTMNGTEVQTGTAVSTGLPSAIYLAAANNAGTPNQLSTTKLKAWFAGASLTDGEQSTLKTIIDNYIAAIP